MSSVDSSHPEAEGNLLHTPFLHLVLYMHQRRRSGTLVIQQKGRETKVLFRDGKAVAARPVERGSTLQPGLLPLCALLEAPYTFWRKDLVEGTTGVVKGTVDPYLLVTDSLRAHVRDDVVNSIVDRYMDVAMVLQPEAPIRRLGIRGQDQGVIALLQRGPITPAGVIAQSVLPRDHTRRLVYALLITKCATPVDAVSGTSGVRRAVTVAPPWAQPTSSAPPPPPSSSPAAQSGSHPPAAPSSSGVPAWKSLATLRPPGARNSSAPPGSLPPGMTPAHGTPRPPLSTPPAQSVELLDDPGKFRRVEQLVERRNFEEASRILDGLIERHPLQPEYLAMRAWLRYSAMSGTKVPPDLLDALRHALQVDPDNPRALYTKGMLLKRMGKESDARRYFRRVVELNPRHLEARRELRLMRMRKKR